MRREGRGWGRGRRRKKDTVFVTVSSLCEAIMIPMLDRLANAISSAL